jgi:hypothetical protein
MSAKKKELNTDEMVNEFTSESAFFQPASTQVHKTTSVQTDKPAKYTTHLMPSTIKAVKDWAYHHDMKDYEVVEAAILEFLKKRKEQKQNL